MKVRLGFTLIELTIVVGLMAILAAMAASIVRLPISAARRESAIETVRWMDATARQRAAAGESIELLFDSKSRVTRLVSVQDQRVIQSIDYRNAETPPVLFRVRNSPGRPNEQTVAIRYGDFGTSPSYAFTMDTDREQWWVCLGMTGHYVKVGSQKEMQSFFAWGDVD